MDKVLVKLTLFVKGAVIRYQKQMNLQLNDLFLTSHHLVVAAVESPQKISVCAFVRSLIDPGQVF